MKLRALATPVAAMLAAIAVMGCTDTTSPRDVYPPSAPRGVYSVTGDQTVYLRWLKNPEGDVADPGALSPRSLLAFGTERYGLSEELLARADARLAIPMREGVSSLNLATAVAAVLYAMPRTTDAGDAATA